jgi:micrococcal nuclease
MSNQQMKIDITYTYKCKIVRIIDGDTIVCNIDLGFGTWIHDEHVRLARINTPETRTKDLNEKRRGYEAKQFTEDIIYSSSEIRLKTYKDHGKYGRYVADVFVKFGDNWICVNDRLVESRNAEYVEY